MCERSSMVEYELPKLDTGVRFTSLAPCTTRVCPQVVHALYRSKNEVFETGTGQTLGLRPEPEKQSDEWFRVHGTALTFDGESKTNFAERIARNSPLHLLLTLIMVSLLSGCAASHHYMPEALPAVTYVKYPIVPFTAGPFIWPVRGDVIVPFGVNGKTRNKGIEIKTYEGAPVLAAKSGRVVYCDSRLKGFGNTVIIDHGEGLQTVYAYNSQILVKLGDSVEQGSVIAKAGSTGRASGASLHFEIRKNSEPQNPRYYLP